MEFMHKTSEYVYVYIWGANIYLYLGSLCISRVNISITRKFMHIAGEYIYIYIYMEFIHIAGEYLYI